MRVQTSDTAAAETAWKGLYYVGGVAALLAVLFFRRNTATELVTFNGFGIFDVPETWPAGSADWFTLFQQDSIMGLVLFDLFDLINYALVGLIFLALYGALRNRNKSAMVAATTFGFVGIAVYFASNQAFSMLTLSGRYAAASEAEQAMFLAAGEALLANHNPGTIAQGTGIYISLFLVLLAGLIASIVMLRSPDFHKAAAYCGIIANGFALIGLPALALGPVIAWAPPTISAPFRMIWYILIAIGLFRLAASIKDGESDISSA